MWPTLPPVNEGIVIFGHKDSYAESYAIDNNIEFINATGLGQIVIVEDYLDISNVSTYNYFIYIIISLSGLLLIIFIIFYFRKKCKSK